MRNLIKYPVTDQEIVECLRRLADEKSEEGRRVGLCGDMEPLLLATAADIIAERIKS